MPKHNLILILTLVVGLTGCSSLTNKDLNNPVTAVKFEVAADKQNDPVSGVTPEIQEALIKACSSDTKSGTSREKFIKVVNSLSVKGGTEFLVRVKNGFSIFFMDAQSKKIFFNSGSTSQDDSNTPVSNFSISPIKENSPEKIFVGFFNLAEAKKVLLTWSDGTKSSYQLTNGTLMISPFDMNTTAVKYEIQDGAGKTLYSEK